MTERRTFSGRNRYGIENQPNTDKDESEEDAQKIETARAINQAEDQRSSKLANRAEAEKPKPRLVPQEIKEFTPDELANIASYGQRMSQFAIVKAKISTGEVVTIAAFRGQTTKDLLPHKDYYKES